MPIIIASLVIGFVVGLASFSFFLGILQRRGLLEMRLIRDPDEIRERLAQFQENKKKGGKSDG